MHLCQDLPHHRVLTSCMSGSATPHHELNLSRLPLFSMKTQVAYLMDCAQLAPLSCLPSLRTLSLDSPITGVCVRVFVCVRVWWGGGWGSEWRVYCGCGCADVGVGVRMWVCGYGCGCADVGVGVRVWVWVCGCECGRACKGVGVRMWVWV